MVEIDQPGAVLVRIRWAKTSEAERKRVGKALLEARRKKARKDTVLSKRSRKAAVKS